MPVVMYILIRKFMEKVAYELFGSFASVLKSFQQKVNTCKWQSFISICIIVISCFSAVT